MGILRTIVTIPTDTAIPSDTISNTWHWMTGSPWVAGDLTTINGWLTTFYQVLDAYLTPTLQNTADIRHYDLGDAEPRVPIGSSTIALTIPGTSNIPEEVALCLSFQGAKTSGVNQARRRGRLYLGPFSNGILGASSAGNRPLASAVTAIVAGAQSLLTASVGSTTPKWAVYSPSNASAVEVRNGWVDNAFDTQRRRGIDPTSRTTFS